MVAAELAINVGFATLDDWPWPHLVLEDFLPAEMALEIDRNWPTDGYEWLKHSDIRQPDGTSLRRYQPLSVAFPGIDHELRSGELENAFKARLGVHGVLYPKVVLVEDLPGYKIRPHTDCAGKVITCQVYLAEQDSSQTQGVMLQSSGIGGGVRQIPYRFNYGYAFKVTDRSWHRVVKCEGRRRSIQLIYYSTPDPKI